MKKLYTIFIATVAAISVSLFLTSCEDVISPELEYADPVLVIDAWLTDQPGDQTITVMQTQTYFDNSLPPGVSGATVSVIDDLGNIFEFQESTVKKGDYVWSPVASEVIGKAGRKYTLIVEYDNETFIASSRMGRVPVIDSLSFIFEEENAFIPDSYFAEFWATDLAGPNDTYRIKTWKNGVLLNKPSELNLAYDAGFSAGGNFDGVAFITPIRRGINPFEEDDNDEFVSPYVPGDSVYVEIHSITVEAFNFLSEVAIQTDRPGGFSELFATPLSNVSTNIFNENPNGKSVLGFFNVSSVSALGKKFEEE